MVCLCADDFGLDAGVNAAIVQLADMGRVQATGVLVGAPAFRRGAPALAGLRARGLEVGLHLDFTEFALLPGARRALAALIRQSYVGGLAASTVRAEIHAQLDAFAAACGHAPDFVDGHQHVHQLPVIRTVLLDVLQQRGAAVRPWLRRTRCTLRPAQAGGWRGWAKAKVIETLGAAALENAARQAGFAQNRALLGVHGFDADVPRYRQLLEGWLRAAQRGDLLMCHPGTGDGGGDPLAQSRRVEFQVLADPALDAMLARCNVRLQPLRQTLVEGIAA